MRNSGHALDALTSLHLVDDAEARRALWRSSIASLASALLDERTAAPLEGADTQQLIASVQLAFADKLLDDLDFLSPEAAGAALYEIAAALPPCELKREIGRRTVQRLRSGDAKTFVGLAAQLALSGSKKALSGPAVKGRVVLALDLPLGIGTRADALALALISRREMSREWLTTPSMGSLPSRRLAARLLERAAREAARRAQRGDDSGVRIFQSRAVSSAMNMLLADRESLVWRHVASARGLLSAAIPSEWTEIERGLDASLGVTEWRRAAAALAASIAVRGEASLRVCQGLLASPIVEKDVGVHAAVMLGLPRAIETDPALVEPMLEHLVAKGGIEAIEALIELRREKLGEEVGDRAAARARAMLEKFRAVADDPDEGRIALAQSLLHDLGGGDRGRQPSLRQMTLEAVEAFATLGASSAHLSAQRAIRALDLRLTELEQCDLGSRSGRIRAFHALHEIDVAALEADSLVNLQLLGARGDDPGELLRPIGAAFDRLVQWLEKHEGPSVAGEPVLESEVSLRRRRVRSLLHLVDSDGPHVEDRQDRLRDRRLRLAGLLFHRVASDVATPLHRALCATAARACDALVREELAEVSDVMILAASHLNDVDDFDTLADASMVPELKAVLRTLAKLDGEAVKALKGNLDPQPSIECLRELANALPVATSMRIEALRGELLALADALEPSTWVSSLAQLDEQSPESNFAALEESLHGIARLLRGTRRKLNDAREVDVSAIAALKDLDLTLERKLRGSTTPVDDAYARTVLGIETMLPAPFARAVALALHRAASLPVDAPRKQRGASRSASQKEVPLPAWIPPNRTLGGFYVARPLGMGGGGTVFVARRSEDRHDPNAERFALKVPDYSGAAARQLSEAQFMQLFREEAGALMMLPSHPNLARFVTFDAGAKPKSILVMELVEGPNLERMLEMRELTMPKALELLDGVAAGLEAMHAVGLGHLDVKPSNVIVREGTGQKGVPSMPVLVDFGLAGRKVRPGCGTLDYGGPEVWGLFGNGPHPATPTDVYAFVCLAFELLTTRNLFEGPNEMAIIAQHVSHDGMPSRLAELEADPACASLARTLSKGLRVLPTERATIAEIRAELRELRPTLSQMAWPLAPAALAHAG